MCVRPSDCLSVIRRSVYPTIKYKYLSLQLQRSYDEVFGEVDACRQTAVAAVQKEQRATHMVSELTAMVKEQKGRLSELVRSKHEACEQWQERVSRLEREVVARNKLEVRVQSLQEVSMTLSHVTVSMSF